MHEVLVNRLGGLSLPRKSVVRLTDRPDMTLDVYRGRKTTNQQQQSLPLEIRLSISFNLPERFFSYNASLSTFEVQETVYLQVTVSVRCQNCK